MSQQEYIDWLEGKPARNSIEQIRIDPRIELSQRVKVKCPFCQSPSWKALPDGRKQCRSRGCGKEFGVVV